MCDFLERKRDIVSSWGSSLVDTELLAAAHLLLKFSDLFAPLFCSSVFNSVSWVCSQVLPIVVAVGRESSVCMLSLSWARSMLDTQGLSQPSYSFLESFIDTTAQCCRILTGVPWGWRKGGSTPTTHKLRQQAQFIPGRGKPYILLNPRAGSCWGDVSLSIGSHHLVLDEAAIVKALLQTRAGCQEIPTVQALTIGLGQLSGPLRLSFPTSLVFHSFSKHQGLCYDFYKMCFPYLLPPWHPGCVVNCESCLWVHRSEWAPFTMSPRYL